MTINITVITPDYVLQASDRLMTAIAGGGYDDDANKGLLLQSDDGIFAITFSGLGRFRLGTKTHRIDLWLAERMLDDGLPELPIAAGIKKLAGAATDLSRRFKNPGARLSIVVAGWWRETASSAVMWLISNCLADDARTRLQRANDEFKIQSIPIARKGGMVWISGAWEVMSRPDRRRLKAALSRSPSL